MNPSQIVLLKPTHADVRHSLKVRYSAVRLFVLSPGCLLMMTACLGTSPKEHFYTLSATSTVNTSFKNEDSQLQNAIINLGAVTINEVVDRPQLVMRLSTSQVKILEQQRWAQPLKNEIGRVIANNLSTLLNNQNVRSYPATNSSIAVSHKDTDSISKNNAFKIQINVPQFESNLDKNTHIAMQYNIRRVSDNQQLNGTVELTQPVNNTGYDALVEAQSRALAQMSAQIAEQLKILAKY